MSQLNSGEIEITTLTMPRLRKRISDLSGIQQDTQQAREAAFWVAMAGFSPSYAVEFGNAAATALRENSRAPLPPAGTPL
ncbi:hypothetical protein JW978_02375 [Candidatus Dojkabacteria bacterium]|nr:hypothetical protein [Candidatus Dojkabacteria bacterium]